MAHDVAAPGAPDRHAGDRHGRDQRDHQSEHDTPGKSRYATPAQARDLPFGDYPVVRANPAGVGSAGL